MILLDTNVVSELRKAGRGEQNVIRWIDAQPASALFVSAITVMELEIGVLRMERRDPRQGSVLRRWLETRALPSLAGRILPIDAHVALRCAALHVPDPKPERDAMIAATALVHGFALATRNVVDFQPMLTDIVDPWRDDAASVRSS